MAVILSQSNDPVRACTSREEGNLEFRICFFVFHDCFSDDVTLASKSHTCVVNFDSGVTVQGIVCLAFAASD